MPEPEKARVRRALRRLRSASLNFDLADLEGKPELWRHDERMQPLRAEPPGDPLPDGTWAIARRLMQGYEFADPKLVRAYYDPDAPLEGRDMLLAVRFYGLVFHAGCRVTGVFDRTKELADRPVRVWGWSYGTLEGHFEQGEMHWEVIKWPDTGEVAFRLRARSRRAADRNPVVRLGLRLFGRREQVRFYERTCERMLELTEERLRAR